MNGFTLLLIASTFGVDYGWQPNADGQLEYIVQIEPVTLIALQQGEEIVSQIDPYVQRVRRFRIRQGTDLVPRRGEPPRQPAPTLPADTIQAQVPGVTFGWQRMQDQRYELIVQIAPAKLAAIRSGEDIAAEIPAEIPVLGRLKIISGVQQLPRLGSAPTETAAPNRVAPAAGDPAPAWPLAAGGQSPAVGTSAATGATVAAQANSTANFPVGSGVAIGDSSRPGQVQVTQPPTRQTPAGDAAKSGMSGTVGLPDWRLTVPNASQPAPVGAGVNAPGRGVSPGQVTQPHASSRVYGPAVAGPAPGSSSLATNATTPGYATGSASQAPAPLAGVWTNQNAGTQPMPGGANGYATAPASPGWTSVPNGQLTQGGSSPYGAPPAYSGQLAPVGQGYPAPAAGYPAAGYPAAGYPAAGYPAAGYAGQMPGAQGQSPPAYATTPNSIAPLTGQGAVQQYGASLGAQAAPLASPSPAGQITPVAKQDDDSLLMPWEDPAEKTYLVAYMDQKRKQEAKIPDFWDSLAEFSNDRSLAYLSVGGGGGRNGDEPWWPLSMAMLALFASMGGNLYIGWIAVGIYRRYLDIAFSGDEDRYDRYRDDDEGRSESASRDRGDRYSRSRDRDRDREEDRSGRREYATDYE